MRVQIVVLSSLLSIVQGFTSQNAFAFGRGSISGCAALFPSGTSSPVFYNSLNRLIAQSQMDWSRARSSMERIGIESEVFRQFQQRGTAYGPHFEKILQSLELLGNQVDQIRSPLRSTYYDVARVWVELWMVQPVQHQNVQHLLNFPARIFSMFSSAPASHRQLLIERQRLQSFAEMLQTLKEDIKVSGSGDMSLQDLTTQALSKPSHKRKLSAMERKLLSLSESRRREFLKSCLP